MRLCDLNKALEELCKYCACGSYESCENRCVEFRNISNIATIDAVPVVRCKDCKNGIPLHTAKNHILRNYLCDLHNIDMDTDGFCSCGERKDGDGNG